MPDFSKQRVNTCVRFAKAFSYSIPVQITNDIVTYLKSYAGLSFPFIHTNMLRMDGNKFLINGIGDTYVLTVTVKKDATQQDVEALEKSLESYINFKRGD